MSTEPPTIDRSVARARSQPGERISTALENNLPSLDTAVFRIAEAEFTGTDLLRFAISANRWSGLYERCRHGLACRSAAIAERSLPTDEDQSQALIAFRYQHSLISADEAAEWTDHRGLEWRAVEQFIERRLLRHRHEGKFGNVLREHPPTTEEALSIWRAEAVCSGWWKQTAEALASRLAVWHRADCPAADRTACAALIDEFRGHVDSTPSPEISFSLDQLERLATIELCFRKFASEVEAEAALQKIVERHRLGWVKFDTLCLRYATEERAREALLCIREDGCDAAEVSNWTSAGMRHRQFYANQLPADLRQELMSARSGDLVGPTPLDGGFTVIEMHDRTEPSLSDPQIRQWAATQAMERALGYEIDNRITWLAAL